jgi:hypothetical protein
LPQHRAKHEGNADNQGPRGKWRADHRAEEKKFQCDVRRLTLNGRKRMKPIKHKDSPTFHVTCRPAKRDAKSGLAHTAFKNFFNSYISSFAVKAFLPVTPKGRRDVFLEMS